MNRIQDIVPDGQNPRGTKPQTDKSPSGQNLSCRHFPEWPQPKTYTVLLRGRAWLRLTRLRFASHTSFEKLKIIFSTHSPYFQISIRIFFQVSTSLPPSSHLKLAEKIGKQQFSYHSKTNKRTSQQLYVHQPNLFSSCRSLCTHQHCIS